MIVIGGGPIGIEMAQAFCRLGTKVTVIQRDGQILNKEDKDMADTIMDVMSEEGVTFYLNAAVMNARDTGSTKDLTVRTNEGTILSLQAETILVATGRTPNAGELGLENIGVDYDRGGVKVDDRLRTSRKHIYGAGDVIGGYFFTHSAGYEGSIVVSNAIFHLPRKTDYTYLPWCTYTDPELASIGMNETMAREAGIAYSVWTEQFRNNDRGVAAGETTGKIKMILDEKEKPVGVQILGAHAGELIGEWVAAFTGGMSLTKLAPAVHPYPTLGEINKKVAGDVLAAKIFSDKVKKGLKFFFHLRGRACGEPRAL